MGQYKDRKRQLYKKDYTPVPGFLDLRNFELTLEEFRKAWNIQLFFRFVENHKEYYKEHDKTTWQKVIEASAELQQFLLSRLKPGCCLE